MLAGLTTLALGTATAAARTEMISSFDGTQIKVNFFPTDSTASGARAPTVLFGPGWSSPGATDPEGASDPTIGDVGVGPLRAAGYNVLTWDPRGFGDSGGVVEVDSPDAEARDVKVLVSYVAKQPEAKLDHKGDPRVGMTGASYGGGVQLSAAAIDRRIDVIVPDIAWHSLTTSLYQDSTFKAGWGSLLYSLGKANGTLDPHIDSAYFAGQSTGQISSEDEDWFRSRGPGDLVKRVKIPTMLVQGTVDTLFTLDEAITNYRILQHNGVPLKMLWFCGGHGSCLTDPGNTDRIEKASIAWLDRWLKHDRSVHTGPGFEWINQDGERFTSKHYPRKHKTIAATGDGSLPIAQAGGSGPSQPGPGAVGSIAVSTNGSKATNAVNLTVPGDSKDRQLVGIPKLSLDYSGNASSSDVRVFAQLVDDDSDLVLGNQVTPIPLNLDGKSHQVSRPLEVVAHTLRPGSSVTLQITASATNYGLQRATGTVDFKHIDLRLPVVKARPKSRP
jgi:ABC-2 type transport system ATP-binding protein